MSGFWHLNVRKRQAARQKSLPEVFIWSCATGDPAGWQNICQDLLTPAPHCHRHRAEVRRNRGRERRETPVDLSILPHTSNNSPRPLILSPPSQTTRLFRNNGGKHNQRERRNKTEEAKCNKAEDVSLGPILLKTSHYVSVSHRREGLNVSYPSLLNHRQNRHLEYKTQRMQSHTHTLSDD